MYQNSARFEDVIIKIIWCSFPPHGKWQLLKYPTPRKGGTEAYASS